MFIRTLIAATAVALTATPTLADDHAGKKGYALTGGGTTLVVMADIAGPAQARAFKLTQTLDAIAWRPVTGQLLGFSNDAIYLVDPASGDLTDLKAEFMDEAHVANGAMAALDFNNKIDAVRAVSSKGDNLVYFPQGFGDGDAKANTVRRFKDLAYAADDPNAGSEPEVFANAYTNAIGGRIAETTFQYALDARTNALVSLANNAGTLKTVGPIMIDGAPADITAWGGFDIVSEREGDNHAFAVLQISGEATAGLYAIDLVTGAATRLTDLGMGGFTGFAVSMQR